MEELVRSRRAMALLVVAAAAEALSSVFVMLAYATLTPGHVQRFRDLQHAANWLAFAAAVVGLGAVGLVAWEALVTTHRAAQAELAAASAATLLIAIGTLVGAAAARASTAASVLEAIGVAGWALLALTRAARNNLAHHQDSAAVAVTEWLVAAAGLTLFAVGSGFTPGLSDRGVAVAQATLFALGAAGVDVAVVMAIRHGRLGGPASRLVVVALGLEVVAALTLAVVAALVFTPHATLTSTRVGLSIASFLAVTFAAALALAAWQQLVGLSGGQHSTLGPSTEPGAPPPPPWEAVPPGSPTVAPLPHRRPPAPQTEAPAPPPWQSPGAPAAPAWPSPQPAPPADPTWEMPQQPAPPPGAGSAPAPAPPTTAIDTTVMPVDALGSPAGRPTGICPNGHAVGSEAAFCSTCGAPLR